MGKLVDSRSTKPAGKYPKLCPVFSDSRVSKSVPKVSSARKKRPCENTANSFTLAYRPKASLQFANGYNPTPQVDGHFYRHRGNAPGNLSDEDWAKFYNNADSRLRKGGNWSTEMAEASRLSGQTRAEAIKDLIQKDKLSAGFVDDNA